MLLLWSQEWTPTIDALLPGTPEQQDIFHALWDCRSHWLQQWLLLLLSWHCRVLLLYPLWRREWRFSQSSLLVSLVFLLLFLPCSEHCCLASSLSKHPIITYLSLESSILFDRNTVLDSRSRSRQALLLSVNNCLARSKNVPSLPVFNLQNTSLT